MVGHPRTRYFIRGFCGVVLYVNVLTHVGWGQRTISGVEPCLPLCVVRFLFSFYCLCQACWLLRILLSASHLLVGRLGLERLDLGIVQLLCECGDLNSGPNAYTASTFTY